MTQRIAITLRDLLSGSPWAIHSDRCRTHTKGSIGIIGDLKSISLPSMKQREHFLRENHPQRITNLAKLEFKVHAATLLRTMGVGKASAMIEACC